MKEIFITLTLLCSLSSFPIFADQVIVDSTLRNSQNVTIDSIIEWQDNLGIFFVLSNGEICYIPYNEDKMYSAIMAAYIARIVVGVHTLQQTTTTQAGVTGYRVHRLWLSKP